MVTALCVETDISVFGTAGEALAAATQRRTTSRARMALHTGDAVEPVRRRCLRLCEIANESQTLISAQTAAELHDIELFDLGIHRLRDLASAARVYSLDGDAEPRSLDAVPNNLPVQATSFVGRRAEAEAIRRLLRSDGLVTLTGPGGGGKTRLAAQVSADDAQRWPGGVWWVELASVVGEVAEAVASAVGVLVEPRVGALRSLTAELRERKALVCLDNCEHVLDAAAEVAAALTTECPEVTVLATSREPLGIPGETVWLVPTLANDEAVALFLERAEAVRPGFDADASVVRTMCTRLDGIPLAIELAAAWLRTLTPQQIEASLDDRFALLVRGPRGAAARQQTLAASVDWSHELLAEADRVVLRRLSVFAGSFTLAAANAVCGHDVLAAIGRLVDKSLVAAEEARFRLLETIREYASARLAEAGEADDTRDRHVTYYLDLAEAAEPELGRDRDRWRSIVEPERDNVRAALDWALAAADPTRGRRLAASLAWLWNINARGHEGMAYLRRAIDLAPDDRTSLQVRLLVGIAEVADTTAPLETFAQDGVDIATELGDERLRARCLGLLALERLAADFDESWELCLRAEQGDEYTRDSARVLRGIILVLRDRYDEALALLAEAVEGLVRRADRGIAATAFEFMSSAALYTGEIGKAKDWAARAVATAEPMGDFHRVGMARSQLALAHCFAGEIDAGMRVMEPFLRLVAGTSAFVPGMARAMGELHFWRGEVAEALTWYQGDMRLGDMYITALNASALARALRVNARTDEARDVLERTVELARRGGMNRIVADALEQQAFLASPDQAVELHHQALAIRVEHGLRTFYVDSLDALAPLMAKPDDATRVLAASTQARREMGYPRRPADAVDAVDGLVMSLDDAVAFVRRTRGSRGRPTSGWDSLTPTELEVVRLAVAGLNNPEIGTRLFMSRGTVKTHLSHVYAKLGIANRTELATLAAAR
ncbi:helix-turn-helix transcriptional regulator [Actinocrispum wychmicini]|uniref:Putative ATPase n=1 Tax=Actinocrispum wychmicini TaxID=1213861 RepID=A0A4R2JZ25_9PSEU|nr:LuxR C-terminal-related transcriptional regulator [Actinocrispum wychmicini]TCO62698.1 putative ATPase [Actinocrispum wychmicini]